MKTSEIEYCNDDVVTFFNNETEKQIFLEKLYKNMKIIDQLGRRRCLLFDFFVHHQVCFFLKRERSLFGASWMFFFLIHAFGGGGGGGGLDSIINRGA